MSRIAGKFDQLRQQGRKALIPFVTAGDPHPDLTPSLLHALVASGADIIELGVPFSDPMADGPTIQRASERALAKGVTLRKTLAMVAEFRRHDADTPLVLMGYANPVEAWGYAGFVHAAVDAGVDGVLIVDYPPHACGEFSAMLREAGMDAIFLLAPTSGSQRIDEVAANGSGYVYYVSLKGVTGSAAINLDEVANRLPALREQIGLPIGVGFGIRDAASAVSVARVADAVVIGSKIIETMENAPTNAVAAAAAFVSEVRAAMDKGDNT